MRRFVFDSNVLLSAFIAEGYCHEIYQVVCYSADILVSQHILNEVKYHLFKKFRYSSQETHDVMDFIQQHSQYVSRVPKLPRRVCRDKDDDAILTVSRASVPNVLIRDFGYEPDTALLATMSGHTANQAIVWLLERPNPENNLLPLITYWVAARSSAKGGLEMADQRMAALTQTWARRTGQPSADQVLMEAALRENMEIAQRAGDVLVNMAKLQSDEALVRMVNEALEVEYLDA
ncbi:MAG: putative toxin-antitoxin system toxin component, PIN family [Candidatus Kerfeldbacteria bacterium]|nr:putative toxin-antitoxin system toxin component, PIN family [Candidatus Kerfeldbacteria bacterium]